MKLLIRVLEALVEDVPSLHLVDLKGGDKHNAIPREAFATVLLPKGARSASRSLYTAVVGCFRRRPWVLSLVKIGSCLGRCLQTLRVFMPRSSDRHL